MAEQQLIAELEAKLNVLIEGEENGEDNVCEICKIADRLRELKVEPDIDLSGCEVVEEDRKVYPADLFFDS